MNELKWIATARTFIGVKEISGPMSNPIITKFMSELGFKDGDNTPWCGGFVYSVQKSCGLKYPIGPALSTNWLTVGTKLDAPAYGCIAVFTRPGGAGHVGYIVGRDKSTGMLKVLSGNQSNQVSIMLIPEERAVGYRWVGYKDRPLPMRYTQEGL